MVTLRHLPHNCGAEVEVLSILVARPMDLPAGKAGSPPFAKLLPTSACDCFSKALATPPTTSMRRPQRSCGRAPAALVLEGIEPKIRLRVSL